MKLSIKGKSFYPYKYSFLKDGIIRFRVKTDIHGFQHFRGLLNESFEIKQDEINGIFRAGEFFWTVDAEEYHIQASLIPEAEFNQSKLASLFMRERFFALKTSARNRKLVDLLELKSVISKKEAESILDEDASSILEAYIEFCRVKKLEDLEF